jgi:acetylornithine deacetylase/succinyl-diaminopimelate desuccinylase-like protein
MSKKKSKIPQKDKIHISPKFATGSTASETAIKLLQMMVQTNTSNPPGNEIVLVQKLDDWIKKEWISKLKLDFIRTHVLISEPTRASLVVEIIGIDPANNPSWGFMSHLDVVPAEGQWRHSPFSADITEEPHDKFIWGRGALDIKNLGAVNLMSIYTLLLEGFRPKGTIKILLMADEECGGSKGLGYHIEHNFEAVKVDCCLNVAVTDYQLKMMSSSKLGRKAFSGQRLRQREGLGMDPHLLIINPSQCSN